MPGKAALMCLVIYFTKEDPLLTMGDAVASFLGRTDPTTGDLGLVSLNECKGGYDIGPKPWHNHRWRWLDTTSRQRRAVTLSLYYFLAHESTSPD